MATPRPTDKRVLSEIWVYPVKSLGGIRLSSARAMEKGLEFDRRWMLVDEANVFMTQRITPAMALLKLHLDEKRGFVLQHFEDTYRMPLQPETTEVIRAKVWDDEVSVIEVSQGLSTWASAKLGKQCKLVFFPEDNPRPVEPGFARHHEQVSLSDGFPILILGEASLADLNARLASPVPMNRFRPNFIFTGGTAFEEDDWAKFTISGIEFAGVKPCARCVMTTINQDTAEKSKEPLATLALYRNRNGKVYFGQNVLAIGHGQIKEGDEIIIG